MSYRTLLRKIPNFNQLKKMQKKNDFLNKKRKDHDKYKT